MLARSVATGFVMTDSGRILHDNAPDRSPGPRLYLAGCQSGNLLRLRHDVSHDTARAIEVLAADEPPLCDPGSTPTHLDAYLDLLALEAPVQHCSPDLEWYFPPRLAYRSDVDLVTSGTLQGDQLLRHLSQDGMPQPLLDLGFVDVGHFWAPWCVALHEGEIASIAFAARLGPNGAATGVVTLPEFRGRGFATAATAGWASLPALHGRTLFYGTHRSNVSSQRVAQRLGLLFLGASLTIA
jgi:GNAT superfamily N-acetyltransferase